MAATAQIPEQLERFVQGDADAFEALFRRYQREVFGWIMRIVRDPAAAEELTIETFWRIYRAHARFDPRRSFSAWARRIATNAALDHLKRPPAEVELAHDPPDAAASAADVKLATRQAVEQAFVELSPKLRVAATLALIEEQSYGEIAEALGISQSAVKLRVFRAARQLRTRLKQLGMEP